MFLFYDPQVSFQQKNHCLDIQEAHHLIHVLRKNKGDTIHVTNGKGQLFKAVISHIESKKRVYLNLVETLNIEKPTKEIHLAVGVTKMMERFEWMLEKATEIGVSAFTPIFSNNSERTKIQRVDRLEKKIIGAMKQSHSCYLPVLYPPKSLDALLTHLDPNTSYLAHCKPSNKTPLSAYAKEKNGTLIIGPEGDFTSDEIQKAERLGIQSVSIGDRRLRVETAAVVAATIMLY